MSTITDIRCVLNQKALDTFCDTFHILDEGHPVLPNPTDTMHEMPTGKIGLYTRFYDFANFRLLLSTFLVDILRHFRINISQLFVIGAAKNNRFFWVDEFACPASFPWRTAKHIVRDPFPATSDFNAKDYATLVAHPFPFRKFPKPFPCLVRLSRHYTLDEDTYPWFVDRDGEDMDPFAFIHVPNPTKVRLVERERAEGIPGDLEANVNRLFDEGGSGASGEQEDGAAAGVRIMSGEDLRSDYIAPNVAPSAGKSPFGLRDLLARSMLNVESGAEVATMLPFVTSSVSTTPEHDSGVPTAPERSAVIPPVVTEAVITTQVSSIPSTTALEPSTK
nr:hypothetical protein [Tanacetum cinerariifolium]